MSKKEVISKLKSKESMLGYLIMAIDVAYIMVYNKLF